MKIHLGESKEFSEEEASMGIGSSRSKFGFELNKSFLIETANHVLKQVKLYPNLKFKDVLKETLLGIRFQEREAYASAVGKMFSNRSVVRRLNQRRQAA